MSAGFIHLGWIFQAFTISAASKIKLRGSVSLAADIESSTYFSAKLNDTTDTVESIDAAGDKIQWARKMYRRLFDDRRKNLTVGISDWDESRHGQAQFNLSEAPPSYSAPWNDELVKDLWKYLRTYDPKGGAYVKDVSSTAELKYAVYMRVNQVIVKFSNLWHVQLLLVYNDNSVDQTELDLPILADLDCFNNRFYVEPYDPKIRNPRLVQRADGRNPWRFYDLRSMGWTRADVGERDERVINFCPEQADNSNDWYVRYDKDHDCFKNAPKTDKSCDWHRYGNGYPYGYGFDVSNVLIRTTRPFPGLLRTIGDWHIHQIDDVQKFWDYYWIKASFYTYDAMKFNCQHYVATAMYLLSRGHLDNEILDWAFRKSSWPR